MKITCNHCGTECEKPPGAVNRARRSNLPLYCNRTCAGLARRKPEKTKEQKVAEKSAYDRLRRERDSDRIKAQKRESYKANYDPVKAAEYRQKRMPYHVEYCRRPEYRERKREYDREYRAKQEFGEFWESALLILDIHRKALELEGSAYELRKSKGYYDRNTVKRRRAYDRLNSEEPEDGALGNLERGERR